MVLVPYRLKQWMDFDQICIDALLGGGKELKLNFGDLDLIFKFTAAL